ncbi:NACHT domain-containing protein [Sphingopyxis fribergensis]
MIGGGPGSGKSTTLKSISSRLAETNSIRPLFIPLQHIDLHKDLRESINSFFVDSSDSAFTQPPLSRASVEDGAPLLLIFDGLDELVAPGEAAKDVVGTFANRLNSLVSALSGSGARTIKVVVSGRMPAFQAATRYLTPRPHGALEAYGFLPVEGSGSDDDPLWKIDQRPTWWGQYARLTGQGAALPEAFSNERLSGITHEPLLCYLLVLAGFATEHWELAAENRNRIYAALIGSVYERGWGDGTSKRLGPGRTLSKPDFNKLMETIALAAWLGGDARVASEEKFEESIEITDAKQAWSSFCEDNGNDVTNLAMNFYFKASEKNQRGFEFTHKSFGEYLAARALLYIAEDIREQVPKRSDYAMRDWFRATKTGGFTLEMLSFLRDEIRLRVSEVKDNSEIDKIVDLKSQFQTLARKASVEGFPVSMTALQWRIMEIEHASAECSLWSIINSCARALGEYGYKDKSLVKMNWIDESELSDILIRHSRFDTSGIINRCLSYVDADDQKLSNLRLHDVNLEMASLSNSLIISCTFISGSLAGANLEGCRIYDSRVEDIDFSKSKLEGSVFHASKIRQCNFMEVTGDAITMSPMTLISSTSSIFHQLGSRLHLMVTSEDSLERVSEGVQERLKILGSLNTVERHDLVEE